MQTHKTNSANTWPTTMQLRIEQAQMRPACKRKMWDVAIAEAGVTQFFCCALHVAMSFDQAVSKLSGKRRKTIEVLGA